MNKSFLVCIASIFILCTESWALSYGGQNMVGDLKKVLVRAPDASFGKADPEKWHYTGKPNLQNALKEHEEICDILRKEGAEVVYHKEPLDDHADAIYVHDPVIMTNKGSIILRMGKNLRRGEEEAVRKTLEGLGIPTLKQLDGNATAEGGDIVWINEKTLAIGRSYRTNAEAIRQITEAVKPLGVEVITVDLPHDQGAEACLHLQSLISFVDWDKAAVYLKFLPVSFVEFLKAKNIQLIEVPDKEYSTMGPNILAIKPNVLLTIEGNPETKRRLEKAGCKVYTYKGDDISLKSEGGATCLTRPILRSSK